MTEGASSVQEEIAHLLDEYPEIPYVFLEQTLALPYPTKAIP